MTQSNNGHTMTTHEALEVLKATNEWRNSGDMLYLDAPHTFSDFTQAITIAIEVMEGRKDEIMKAYEAGCDDSTSLYNSCDPEQYYNSLTYPAGSGDEQP